MADRRGFGSAALAGIVTGAILGGCVVIVDRGAADWDDSTPRPRLGVHTAEPGRALATQLNIDRSDATVITRVVNGSSAERAGLREYDVITRIDGSESADPSDLRRALRAKQWGDSISLVVMRDGQPLDMLVTLEQPAEPRKTPNY